MKRVLVGWVMIGGCGPSLGDEDGPPVARTCDTDGAIELGWAKAGSVVRLDAERFVVIGYENELQPGAWDVSVVDECGETSTRIPAASDELSRAIPGVAAGHLLGCDFEAGGIHWYDVDEPGRSHPLFPVGVACKVWPVGGGLAAIDSQTGTMLWHPNPARADAEPVEIATSYVSEWGFGCAHAFDDCEAPNDEPSPVVVDERLWIPEPDGDVVAHDPVTSSFTSILEGAVHFVPLAEPRFVLWEDDGHSLRLYDRQDGEHRSIATGQIPYNAGANGPWVSVWSVAEEGSRLDVFHVDTETVRDFASLSLIGATPDGRAILESHETREILLLTDPTAELIGLGEAEELEVRASQDGAVLVWGTLASDARGADFLANGSTRLERLAEATQLQSFEVLDDGTFVAHEGPHPDSGQLVAYRNGARTVIAEDVAMMLPSASTSDEIVYATNRAGGVAFWRVTLD